MSTRPKRPSDDALVERCLYFIVLRLYGIYIGNSNQIAGATSQNAKDLFEIIQGSIDLDRINLGDGTVVQIPENFVQHP